MPRPVELSDFSGTAALFPLPRAVFYPGTTFPLHIFEPRYRQMTADALDGTRWIAMAHLKPGGSELPLSSNPAPAIYEMACLCKITAEELLPDGRYYLLLEGLSRAKVIGELPLDLPYRIGQLELCPDREPSATQAEQQRIKEDLLRVVQTLYPHLELQTMFVKALEDQMPVGEFSDLLAHALKFHPPMAQRLLEILDPVERGQMVLSNLEARLHQSKTTLHRPHAPKFSLN